MPRLLGVEIPADKRIEASLTYIYGIGPSIAKRILDQTNIDLNLRAKNRRGHPQQRRQSRESLMAEPTKPAEDAVKKPRPPKADAKEAAPKPEATEVQGEAAKADASPAVSVATPVEPKKKAAPKGKREEAAAPAAAPAENLSLSPDSVEQPKIVKAKGSKNIHNGVAHILATFNNTIVTITDMKGNVIG